MRPAVLLAAALGLAAAACGSSASAPDADPSSGYDCAELAEAWQAEIAAVSSCDRADDCAPAGVAPSCDEPSISCGGAVNPAEYQGSRAEDLARLFSQRACGETTADCGTAAGVACVSHRCVITYDCCYCLPPPDAGLPDANGVDAGLDAGLALWERRRRSVS